MPSDQHHRQAFIHGLEAGQQFQAIDARQADIADDDASEVLADALERFFGAAHADAGDVFERQCLLATEQYVGVVFDDQDGKVLGLCIHVDSAR